MITPQGQLTDDDHVGIDRQKTSPKNSRETSPLGVLGTRSASKELVHHPEDKHANNLRHNTNGNRKTLKDEVRNVKVGRGWQRSSQNTEDFAWVAGNLDNGGGGRIGNGSNKEHLDNLEDKIRVLGEQLGFAVGLATSHLGQPAHEHRHQ